MTDAVLVLLVDRKHGHFYRFDVGSGRLNRLEELTDDVPRPTKSASWAALADSKVARHIEQHVSDHYERVRERTSHWLQSDPKLATAQVLLGGPEAEVDAFRKLLPKPLRERVIATLHPDHYAGLKELERQISAAVARAGQRSVADLLDRIENDRRPGGRGVVGAEPVYEALNLKQVQILLFDSAARYPGWVCPKDGSLSQSLDRCPICLGAMEPSVNLIGAIRTLAASQGAEVVEVDEPGALARFEHLAALRRY